MLVQLRYNETVQLDDEWQTVITNDNNKSLTLNEITAQSFIFYAMSFCLYEIAKNEDSQRTIQEEIDTALALHDGKFTYESINEIKYSECCIDGGYKLIFVFLTELQNNNVKLGSQHIDKDLEFTPASNVLMPKDGIHLKFQRR